MTTATKRKTYAELRGRRARQLAAITLATAPAAFTEDEVFVPYADLYVHGIPSYCRVHLQRLMRRNLFPQAHLLSPNRIGWRLSDLKAWKASRPRIGGEAV